MEQINNGKYVEITSKEIVATFCTSSVYIIPRT